MGLGHALDRVRIVNGKFILTKLIGFVLDNASQLSESFTTLLTPLPPVGDPCMGS